MADWITPRQFHDAAGVRDWRMLAPSVAAHFRTERFAVGVALVDAIGALGDVAPDVDLRPGGVTVRSIWFQQLDSPRPERNTMHVDVFVPHDEAEARVAAALAAGGRLVFDGQAPASWTLADPEGNEVDVATWQGRD